MTATTERDGTAEAVPQLVTATIDGATVEVPKGTLVIRAAEQVGVHVPRFCDHPLLEPVGACRQCLVDIATPGPDGTMRAMPKPQPACVIELTEGMEVKTQATSAAAEKAQHGVMEFLLINHPLDCPVCDKGGECPLQNQAMSDGRARSRFVDVKRTFPKPIKISSQVLLDRERCVLCQRCTRFSKEIAGDPFIDLQHRGIQQQIGTFSPGVLGIATQGEQMLDESGVPFASYFSGNTIQICPVGALTSAAYRFRSRPFDLVSTLSVCEHCASGCALRTDHRRGTVLRRLAGDDPAVNEEWNCDKGRFAFTWSSGADRLTTPMVRGADGELEQVSWPVALEAAARGLEKAREGRIGTLGAPNQHASGVGVLPGGRLTMEDAYAYAKFARVALGTNDVDHRSRVHSAEEQQFLAHHVAGRSLASAGAVTYNDLEKAPAVLLVAFEPEEESPIVFLRLRKAVRAHRTAVHAVSAFASRGLTKLGGTLLPAAPGTEAEVLAAVASGAVGVHETTDALRAPGAVVLVGERAAAVPGALSAALRVASATGARLAWVPRRAGERGAVEAGTLPGLLPGGRLVSDAEARVDLAAAWGAGSLPAAPGRDATAILQAAADGSLGALVVGGVDPDDLPDPVLARRALATVPFLVSLEVRSSAVTEHADVVLPVAPVAEKAGTFLDWEGRPRPFDAVLDSRAMSDLRVLHALADQLDVDLGFREPAGARAELTELGGWETVAPAPEVAATEPPEPGPGEAVLATWDLLLGSGRLQDGEPFLAGTAHRSHARVSAATAAAAGVADGGLLSVGTAAGAVTVPAIVTDMPDHAVWLPTGGRDSDVRRVLRAAHGQVVRLSPGAAVPVPSGAHAGATAANERSGA
jgi:NADH-quinone oxidoreductase subunit G